MKFSFLERPQFTKNLVNLVDQENYFELQDFLMEHPDWGDVIPRLSYPIRKVRWKVKGQGKRGGARIVYFLAKSDNYIVFLDIWTKNEKENLEKADYEILCDFLKESGI